MNLWQEMLEAKARVSVGKKSIALKVSGCAGQSDYLLFLSIVICFDLGVLITEEDNPSRFQFKPGF